MITLTLQKIIFAILLSLPRYEDDSKIETEQEHLNRIETISSAIATAAHDSICENNNNKQFCWNTLSELELSMLLISKAWNETKFSQHIHAGHCYPGECDTVWRTYKTSSGKEIKYAAYYKARSPWQIHRNYTYVSQDEWDNMKTSSLSSTYTSALVAARLLGFSYTRCQTLSGAVSLYATGKTCRWSGAQNRVYFYTQLLKKANNEEKIQQILQESNVTS